MISNRLNKEQFIRSYEHHRSKKAFKAKQRYYNKLCSTMMKHDPAIISIIKNHTNRKSNP